MKFTQSKKKKKSLTVVPKKTQTRNICINAVKESNDHRSGLESILLKIYTFSNIENKKLEN